MNENKMFNMVIELCKANGIAIDKIAKECGIKHDLGAKMFLETMKSILDKMKDGESNA